MARRSKPRTAHPYRSTRDRPVSRLYGYRKPNMKIKHESSFKPISNAAGLAIIGGIGLSAFILVQIIHYYVDK